MVDMILSYDIIVHVKGTPPQKFYGSNFVGMSKSSRRVSVIARHFYLFYQFYHFFSRKFFVNNTDKIEM